MRTGLVCAVSIVLVIAARPAGAACESAPEPAAAPVRHAMTSIEDWPTVIRECVPPLDTPLGDRWPLTLWESGPPERWDTQSLRETAKRGIVPAIRLDARWVPLARQLQAEGLPVIAIEGRGSRPAWPYTLDNIPGWALEYEDRDVPSAWKELPVPTRFGGWARAAGRLRERLQLFTSAGVTIDGFWLDYETQPSQLDYAAVKSAANAEAVPAAALKDEQTFSIYRRQLWHALISAYVAAPVREAYPRAAVTNWLSLVSLSDAPTHSWRGSAHPASGPTLLTHSNPAAYGIDTGYRAQRSDMPDRAAQSPDWLYLQMLLRQASEDAANRQRVAPYLGSVVWVARWVTDGEVTPTPVMSRATYREALRHLWLRGVDAMAVFNPARPGYARYQLAEVQDAVNVLNEVVGAGDLTKVGTPMNFAVPHRRELRPFWSGMRAGDEAVIRVFNPLASKQKLRIDAWTGTSVPLEVAPGGTTLVLRRGPRGEIETARLGLR